MKEDEDSLQGRAKTPQGRESAIIMVNNTHILDLLDERIFPFKDHEKQLSAFFSGGPLVNIVHHTGLETERKPCNRLCAPPLLVPRRRAG